MGGKTGRRMLAAVLIFTAVPLSYLAAKRYGFSLFDWGEQAILQIAPAPFDPMESRPLSPDRALSELEAALAGAIDIRRIQLDSPAIGDAELRGLSRLQQLQEVDLRGSAITDNSIGVLQAMDGLRRIDLRNTRISLRAIYELQRARPDLEIEHASLPQGAAPGFRLRLMRRQLQNQLAARVDTTPAGPARAQRKQPVEQASATTPARGGDEPKTSGSPTPGAEDRRTDPARQAVERGLDFLSEQQLDDGRWSLTLPNETAEPALTADVAATGLSLLSFLGAGYTPHDAERGEAVRRGVEFLIGLQGDDGLIAQPDSATDGVVQFYSHSIAAMALAETYGMTGSEAYRQPAQSALRRLEETQHAELGGWRYQPQVSSDTSVTGWAMMAYKSGRAAGLHVSDDAWRKAVSWISAAQSPDQPHLYAYNPHAPNTRAQRHGRQPNPTMSAVGMLMRLYSDWPVDDPRLEVGVDYLLAKPPALTAADRDAYYWYYATQVIAQVDGEPWREWRERLYPLLVDSQLEEGEWSGSWDPESPAPDRWGAQAGRLYVTTLHLLCLEVEYRVLPVSTQ
ncbi:MAG: terpene cyclase/mutase family protein [Pirellulaceae bacterium]|nr:terpene cyclase/mutase family protein [Pirellulaceae bacterium]